MGRKAKRKTAVVPIPQGTKSHMPDVIAKRKKTRTLKKVSRTKAVAETPSVKPQTIGGAIQGYCTHMDCLSKALPATMATMITKLDESVDIFGTFLDKVATKKGRGKNTKYIIGPKHGERLVRNSKGLLSASLAVIHVPRIFLCAIVNQYDAFLGQLLKAAFLARPEKLNASEKNITFVDVMKFLSIDEARDAFIEKEVEDVIRQSHVKQFGWMERRFECPLRQDLAIWPDFVELTERRNLLVHTNGIVSSQYLRVCKENGVALDNSRKVGAQLEVSPKYFDRSFDVLFEIGVKLGHVLWRKLRPDEISAADVNLQEITYDLLHDERYSLAIALLEFAIKECGRKSSERTKRINIVNLAIAHKFSGRESDCADVLSKVDWTASSLDFQLAKAVLEERYREASSLMSRIGSNGDVKEENYREWPVFRDFRKMKEFQESYKSVFGKDFGIEETRDMGGAIVVPAKVAPGTEGPFPI